eukprot:TRINITY_DN20941_c0_g1_i1.p1 TRINITY_DN20941_c0_g1~~TRINITY_DN20941_c0_g1_i1.p1  ORF type:complete len:389 (+),score=71.64 TRINITY_DN20941_c0_g1_i1:48-1214(+)
MINVKEEPVNWVTEDARVKRLVSETNPLPATPKKEFKLEKVESQSHTQHMTVDDFEREKGFNRKMAPLLDAPFMAENLITDMVQWLAKNGRAEHFAYLFERKLIEASRERSVDARNENLERIWIVIGQALLDLGKPWREVFYKKFAPGGRENRIYATSFGYLKYLARYLPDGLERDKLLTQMEERNILPMSVITALRDKAEGEISRTMLAEFDSDVEYFYSMTQAEMKTLGIWEYKAVTDEVLEEVLIKHVPRDVPKEPMLQHTANGMSEAIPIAEQLKRERMSAKQERESTPEEHVEADEPVKRVVRPATGPTMTSVMRARKQQQQQIQHHQPVSRKRPATPSSGSSSEEVAIIKSTPSVVPKKRKVVRKKPELNFRNTKDDAICLD